MTPRETALLALVAALDTFIAAWGEVEAADEAYEASRDDPENEHAEDTRRLQAAYDAYDAAKAAVVTARAKVKELT